MDTNSDPFDQHTTMGGFYSPEGINNDVLRYLEFSDSDFPPPAALPPEASDTPHDQSVWDFDDPLINEVALGIRREDKVRGALLPGTSEAAAAMATYDLVPPVQLDCSGCHILREVVHTNGVHNIKLAIHGGLGVFHHAILDFFENIDGFPLSMEQNYFDLSTQAFEEVKQFLLDYGLLRLRDNYIMIEDSISTFYDSLCVKMSYNFENSDTAERCLPEQGLIQSRPTEVNNSNIISIPKTGISAQRERTGKLHLSDLAGYFHLPITKASKELNICSTAMKKICRRHGVKRWPFRKIKSIDRTISRLRKDLSNQSEEEVTRIVAKIEELTEKRAQICAGSITDY